MRAATSLLLAVLLLAGCLDHAASPTVSPQAAPLLKAERWQAGDWWSYHATLHGNLSVDMDLIVDRVKPDGFTLGSNASYGFFGLPFLGNLTRGLNPEIADEVWPMLQLPLADGQSWSYRFWGHEARATAHAATIQVPGAGPEVGFHVEASSLGQTFARYDYAPTPGWLTHLEIVDPGKGGQQVLVADLTGFGANYHGLYYVEETLASLRYSAPTSLPLPMPLDVPPADSGVRAHLSIAWTAGACDATLLDDAGQPLAHAQVLGAGAATDEAPAARGAHRWTLDPKCAGVGTIHVVVTGVKERQGLVG